VKAKDGFSGDISAAFEKTRPGGGTLRLEIVAAGEVVAKRETSKVLGTVDVSWSPPVEATREIP